MWRREETQRFGFGSVATRFTPKQFVGTMNSSTLKNIVEFVAEARSWLLLSKTGMVM